MLATLVAGITTNFSTRCYFITMTIVFIVNGTRMVLTKQEQAFLQDLTDWAVSRAQPGSTKAYLVQPHVLSVKQANTLG